MAAASSPYHKFWVLPCCPFFLNGHKFDSSTVKATTADGAHRGTYERFLTYVYEVGSVVKCSTDTETERGRATVRLEPQ